MAKSTRTRAGGPRASAESREGPTADTGALAGGAQEIVTRFLARTSWVDPSACGQTTARPAGEVD